MSHDSGEVELTRDAVAQFRVTELDSRWDELDRPPVGCLPSLLVGLERLGAPRMGLPEDAGGTEATAAAQVEVYRGIAAASPALAVALLQHLVAARAIARVSAAPGRDADLMAALRQQWFALAELRPRPEVTGAFAVDRGPSHWRLSGTAPALVCAGADQLVVFATDGAEEAYLCLVPELSEVFAAAGSPSGLRLLTRGQVRMAEQIVPPAHIWPLDAETRQMTAAHIDGAVAAIAAGVLGECARRGIRYALSRRQGGVAIAEHDAIRQAIGELLVAEDALQALAERAIAAQGTAFVGAGAAFAGERLPRLLAQAIQIFGGYGYMRDFGIERYFRDTSALLAMYVDPAGIERALAQAALTA
ncbi:MAG: hypothetical protein HYV63_22610 [Candidatus Schekmanbacteria bacterium]|nr:hypothetical protein [Candidatus Schekmanbacteria bacterium]